MSRKISNTTNLTHGNPLKVILIFALPLLLNNLFQQFYNMTDVTIIGHKLGDDALAAIGTVSIIYNMFSSFVFGMGNGFSIVIARFFGASDLKNMRKAIGNVITLSVMVIVFLTIFALSFRMPLLRLINTPEECIEIGLSYLTIMLSGLGLMFIYNVEAGILRALGNSFIPLCVLIMSTIINVFLDIILVVKMELGLKGAAIATVSSVFISCIVCFVYILIKIPEVHISKSDLKLKKGLAIELMTSGLSFALMFTIVNIGTVVLQSAINGLGKEVIAAHTTARKVTELMMMPNSTIGTALATFVSQNHGAGRHDRVIKGIKQTLIFVFIIVSFQIIFIYVVGRSLIMFISGSSNEFIILTAHRYLKFDILFYFALAVLCQLRMALQSLGAKLTPIVASVMEMLLKLFTASILAKSLGYWGIIICEPMIWVICAIYIFVVYIYNPNIKKELKFTLRKA